MSNVNVSSEQTTIDKKKVLAQAQKMKIVCKICGRDITYGWKKKVGNEFVIDRDPLQHVRQRHLSDQFDNWHILNGQQPPSEDEFLEVTY